jgi:hypothetical protein
MIDLSLNEDFSVHLDSTNDLGTVEGHTAFEQSVAVRLTDYMYDGLSEMTSSKETIKEKIELHVSRVAKDHNALDSIANIYVRQDEEDPMQYNVNIEYVANENFEFEVQA